MIRRFLLLALVLTPSVATGQASSWWRWGAGVTLPTRLLNANSVDFPDAVDATVGLGLGFSAEVSRAWQLKPKVIGAVRAQLITASVDSKTAGVDWSPGRAFILDLGGRAERQIGDRTSIFGGASLSHWEGPEETVPFSGLGAVLTGVDAGITLRPGEGLWRIEFGAGLTRIGGDDARDVATGSVWRFSAVFRKGM